MICRNCGRTHSSNERFCGNCGSPLISEYPSPAPVVQKSQNKNILLILVIVMTLLVIVLGSLLLFKGNDDPASSDKTTLVNPGGDTISQGDTTTGGTTGGGTVTGGSGSEKYYPGTDILSFTSVTGIKSTDSYTDESLTTNTYIMNSPEDYNNYMDALKNDGYEVIHPGEKLGGREITVFRKNRNQVCIGMDVDRETKTVDPEIYLVYQTDAGSAGCLSCSTNGHDRCQGHSCDICKGRGSSPCNGCGGSGLARVPSSYSNKCVVCYGGGTQICPNCDGAGKKFIGN